MHIVQSRLSCVQALLLSRRPVLSSRGAHAACRGCGCHACTAARSYARWTASALGRAGTAPQQQACVKQQRCTCSLQRLGRSCTAGWSHAGWPASWYAEICPQEVLHKRPDTERWSICWFQVTSWVLSACKMTHCLVTIPVQAMIWGSMSCKPTRFTGMQAPKLCLWVAVMSLADSRLAGRCSSMKDGVCLKRSPASLSWPLFSSASSVSSSRCLTGPEEVLCMASGKMSGGSQHLC